MIRSAKLFTWPFTPCVFMIICISSIDDSLWLIIRHYAKAHKIAVDAAKKKSTLLNVPSINSNQHLRTAGPPWPAREAHVAQRNPAAVDTARKLCS